ncbi:MAG: RNA polymerase sigma factor [Mariniblastus sp.]
MMPLDLPANSATSETICDEKLADAENEIETTGTPTLSASFCEANGLAAKRYAMSIVHRWSDAEEIVQESFCRIIESSRLSTKKSDVPSATANRKAMLFSIVRNLSIDLLRKKGRRRFELVDTNLVPQSEHGTNESRMEQLETSVQEIMNQMPERWSESLQLKLNGGLTYEEIGKVLNASHSQIRTWIFRARKKLATELKCQGLLGDENE